MPSARPLPGPPPIRAIDDPALTGKMKAFLSEAVKAGPGSTISGVARDSGVEPATVHRWLKTSAPFRRAYESLWREILTTHVPNVVRAVVAKAERGDIPAARLVCDLVGITKQRIEVGGMVEHLHVVDNLDAYLDAARAALPHVLQSLAAASPDVVEGEVVEEDAPAVGTERAIAGRGDDGERVEPEHIPAYNDGVHRTAPGVAPVVVMADRPRPNVLPGGHSKFFEDR